MPSFASSSFPRSLRSACTAPGTSSQLPTSASSRVAASLQRHTERIQRARQQAPKPPCRRPLRSPVVATRQRIPSVVSSAPLCASLSSLSISFRTRPLPRIPDSRIPLRRLGSGPPAGALQSCIRNSALGRGTKTVKFKDTLATVREVRYYEPLPPVGSAPMRPYIRYASDINTPHLAGRLYPIWISRIPTLHGRTLGKRYQRRLDGHYDPPTREGTHGPDGQFRTCPYCRSNCSAGNWILDDPPDWDILTHQDVWAHLHQESRNKLYCEDHE